MFVLWTVLAIIVLLVVVLLVNAARLKPTSVTSPIPHSEEMGTDEAVARFQEMLRSKTVWGRENPDADHAPFDEFVPKLKRLFPLVFEKLDLQMVNTYGILLTWKGDDLDLKPIILMAHHDVVEADPTGWTHDPFAAEIVDGKIWARGSVDTKCILAGLLEATETLLSQGYQPPRTIYIWSSNCEEDNGDTTPAAVEWFQKQGIDPLFVLDEGGAIIDNAPLGVDCEFALIGVTEKGLFNAFLTTNAAGGHASTPALTDATSKLVSGLDDLQKTPAPSRLSAPVEMMLKELAAHGSFGIRLVMGNLWLFRPLVLSILRKNPETAAMVRTTYALTELEGSPTANVIPKQAHACVNVRVDPAESVEEAKARILSHFDADTECRLRDANEPSPISPFDDEVFEYLRAVTNSVYPDAGIAPYVQVSCSDSRHFARIYPRVYRFAGILFKGDQRARIHGQDENLDVESYKRGVGFYIEFIRHIDLLGREA